MPEIEMVQIPRKLWKKLEKLMENAGKEKRELITEKEAANLLGITKLTLQNYVCNSKIKRSCYTKQPNGRRLYYKDALKGLV